eukprot:2637485-Pyramimonas_sp.AAC.1
MAAGVQARGHCYYGAAAQWQYGVGSKCRRPVLSGRYLSQISGTVASIHSVQSSPVQSSPVWSLRS